MKTPKIPTTVSVSKMYSDSKSNENYSSGITFFSFSDKEGNKNNLNDQHDAMKLFLIERTDVISWNQIISVIVCAKDEKEALSIKIGDKHEWTRKGLKISLIGLAIRDIKKGIIMQKNSSS